MEDLPKLIINFDQLGHKTGMFSTHSRIYLEINQKKYENLTNMWKLNSPLLIIHRSKKKSRGQLENSLSWITIKIQYIKICRMQQKNTSVQFSSFQSLSHVRLFVTPWIAARQTSLSITNSRSLPKLTSIELVMPFNHLILRRPLLLLPSIFPSIKVFSNESALRIRWPKYWSFSFNISSSNEHPRLVSFRMDWLDLLAVQGTLKSLLQYLSSKASIFQCSAFFIVQLSHPYMTAGKTIALTIWTFVGKIMSLLFNMLSRLS